MDECAQAFYPHLQAGVTDLLYGEAADEKTLAQTSVTQCVVFALDYALGRYLLQIGLEPSFLVGHSIGEWVAACLAGAIDLPAAARLVAARARLMSALPPAGGMAAVFAPVPTIEEFLIPFDGSLKIAAYNISHLVVSGATEALTRFLGFLRGRGITSKALRVSHAFHTPLMEPMVEDFRLAMADVGFRTPQIPVVSCLTGGVIDRPPEADHWLRHVLDPVRFQQAVDFMRDKRVDVFLEVGPDKVLSGMVGEAAYRDQIRIHSSCNRYGDALAVFLDTLGHLFAAGVRINWREFEKDFGHKKVLLPAYPFAREDYRPDFGDRVP